MVGQSGVPGFLWVGLHSRLTWPEIGCRWTQGPSLWPSRVVVVSGNGKCAWPSPPSPLTPFGFLRCGWRVEIAYATKSSPVVRVHFLSPPLPRPPRPLHPSFNLHFRLRLEFRFCFYVAEIWQIIKPPTPTPTLPPVPNPHPAPTSNHPAPQISFD